MIGSSCIVEQTFVSIQNKGTSTAHAHRGAKTSHSLSYLTWIAGQLPFSAIVNDYNVSSTDVADAVSPSASSCQHSTSISGFLRLENQGYHPQCEAVRDVETQCKQHEFLPFLTLEHFCSVFECNQICNGSVFVQSIKCQAPGKKALWGHSGPYIIPYIFSPSVPPCETWNSLLRSQLPQCKPCTSHEWEKLWKSMVALGKVKQASTGVRG